MVLPSLCVLFLVRFAGVRLLEPLSGVTNGTPVSGVCEQTMRRMKPWRAVQDSIRDSEIPDDDGDIPNGALLVLAIAITSLRSCTESSSSRIPGDAPEVRDRVE